MLFAQQYEGLKIYLAILNNALDQARAMAQQAAQKRVMNDITGMLRNAMVSRSNIIAGSPEIM